MICRTEQTENRRTELLRIRTVVAGTAAAVALLAGCGTSGGTSGTPTTASQATTTGNSAGAPKISNPLDVKTAEATPCGVVTPAQLQEFGLPGVEGSLNTTSIGAGCLWSGTFTAAETAAGVIIPAAGTSLDSLYAKKDSTYPVFEPLEVQGYPAAVALVVDQRKSGNCELFVGVADDRVIMFSLLSDEKSKYFADPCAGAAAFANLGMTTIKAGAK